MPAIQYDESRRDDATAFFKSEGKNLNARKSGKRRRTLARGLFGGRAGDGRSARLPHANGRRRRMTRSESDETRRRNSAIHQGLHAEDAAEHGAEEKDKRSCDEALVHGPVLRGMSQK
jgi:hypothetical protein